MVRLVYVGLFVVVVLACDSSRGATAGARDSAHAASATKAAVPEAPMYTLATGTTIRASIQSAVSSRSNVAGDKVSAIVSLNVMDGAHVAIPGGTAIALTIAQLRSARNSADADGMIVLDVTSLTVNGAPYTPAATVAPVPHTLRGRSTDGATSATQTDRDVIVTPGTPITITLTHPLKIAAS